MRVIILALGAFPNYSRMSRIVLAIYGIWNLDFFRTFMPPICLNISTLQVHAFDYAIAVCCVPTGFGGSDVHVDTATCTWVHATGRTVVTVQEMLYFASEKSQCKDNSY